MTFTNITMATGAGGGGGGGTGTFNTSYGAVPPIGTVSVTSGGTSYPLTANPQTVTIGAVGSAIGLSSGTGAFITSTSSGPVWTNHNNANIRISGDKPKLSTDKNEIDLDELAETMRILRERFLIIIPDFEKHEKYAALKKAYEHYKLLESMVVGEKK